MLAALSAKGGDGPRAWPNGKAARGYLTERRVMHMVEQGLGQLLEARPENPCGWLAGFMKDKNVLRKRTAATATLANATVQLTHVDPTPAAAAGLLPGHRWRGGEGVWGCRLPSLDGFKDIFTHLKKDQGMEKVLVVSVERQDLTYIKGSCYSAQGYPLYSAMTFAEACTADGRGMWELKRAVSEAAAAAKIGHHFVDMPLRNSLVVPELPVYDQVVDVVDVERAGLTETQTTAVLVVSLDGGDDVAVGMSLFATVVQGVVNVRSAAAKKAAWQEAKRDSVVQQRAARASIEALHAKGVAADNDYFEKHEQHVLSSPVPEGAADAERRRADYEAIRDMRQAQLDKFLTLEFNRASSTIGKVARGHLVRKEGPRVSATAPSEHTTPASRRKKRAGPAGKGSMHPCCVPEEEVYKASLKEVASLSVVERCVRHLESHFRGDLFTRCMEKRVLREVEVEEVAVNPRKMVTDKATITHHSYDIHLDKEDLFVFVKRMAPESSVPTDFSLSIFEYLKTMRECLHGRCLVTDLAAARKKYVGAYAIQNRILRSLELIVYGMSLYAWVAVRECQRKLKQGDSAMSVFAVDGCEGLPERFSTWLGESPVYQELEHPHMMMLGLLYRQDYSQAYLMAKRSKGAVLSTLTDRVLLRVGPTCAEEPQPPPAPGLAGSSPAAPSLAPGPPSQGPVSFGATELLTPQDSELDGGSRVARAITPTSTTTGMGQPSFRQRSLSFMGKQRTHCFRRYHRKVPVFSVVPPLVKDDLTNLFRGYSRAKQSVLWLSLTPALTAFVRPAGFIHAPLATAAHRPDARSVARLSSCKFVEPDMAGSVSVRGKEKAKRLKRRQSNAQEFKETEFADGEASGEVPVFGHLWSHMEGRFVEEVKAQLIREQGLAFSEWADTSPADKTKQLQEATVPYRPPSAPEAKSSKGRSRQGSAPSKAGSVSSGDGRGGYSSTADDGKGGSPAAEPVVSEKAGLAGVAEAVKCEQLQYHRQPVVLGAGEAMWGLCDVVTQQIAQAMEAVKAAEGRAMDAAVVVWHEDEGAGHANPLMMLLATVGYSLHAKRLWGEDPVEMLMKTRRTSEQTSKRRVSVLSRGSRHSRSTHRSARETKSTLGEDAMEEETEDSYDEEEEEEEMSLDEASTRAGTQMEEHETATQAPGTEVGEGCSRDGLTYMATVGDTTTLKPLFSTVPVVDALVSSDLGCDMELIEAIQYLDQVFELGPKAVEEGLVGKMTEALGAVDAALADGLPDEVVKNHAQQAVSLLECYVLALFYVAWLTAHLRAEPGPPAAARPSTPDRVNFPAPDDAPVEEKPPPPPYKGSFASFLTEQFPEAGAFLAEMNPWKDQRRIHPAWLAPQQRWRRSTLIHEVH